jgi:hypothetical protein
MDKRGIYVLIDLQSVEKHIDRDAPKYTTEHYAFLRKKVDEFAKYSNTIGFIAGNEVANEPGKRTESTPFIKATVRDVKEYMRVKNYRQVPVGYTGADDTKIRQQEAAYYLCGPPAERANFYGLNVYSFCGNATFEESGWKKMVDVFREFKVPLFLGEFGCNIQRPRVFKEVNALFKSPMTDVFSGGIAYEFSEEANAFGLVKMDANREKLEDYGNLKKAYSQVSFPKAAISFAASSQNKCPAQNSGWLASPKLPETPSEEFCKCSVERAACKYAETDETQMGKHLDALCGFNVRWCSEISANGSTGVYGSYSACSVTQKLSLVLNERYRDTGECSKPLAELGKPKEQICIKSLAASTGKRTTFAILLSASLALLSTSSSQ